MNYNYGKRGILQVDGARITFKNFAGRAERYNREGDRSFALIIPNEEIANELIADGWNVKIKPPRMEGDAPFMYMNIKVKYGRGDIDAYLISGDRRIQLDSESIGCLDTMNLASVDLDIRPWDHPSGEYARSAYLQSIEATQAINRFDARWNSRNEE